MGDSAGQDEGVEPAGGHGGPEHLGEVLVREGVLVKGKLQIAVITEQNILKRIIRRIGLTSPLVDLAWFSSCLFWIHLVFSWYCFSTMFWCLLNLMDS